MIWFLFYYQLVCVNVITAEAIGLKKYAEADCAGAYSQYYVEHYEKFSSSEALQARYMALSIDEKSKAQTFSSENEYEFKSLQILEKKEQK